MILSTWLVLRPQKEQRGSGFEAVGTGLPLAKWAGPAGGFGLGGAGREAGRMRSSIRP